MRCTHDPEQLPAWLDGDLKEAPASRMADHIRTCPECRGRLSRLRDQDRLLRAEVACPVPPGVITRMRQALPCLGTDEAAPEVLALEDVALYLRVALDDLDRVAPDLPAFEVAGQIRVRRTELERWIARREQDYAAQRLRETLGRGGGTENVG